MIAMAQHKLECNSDVRLEELSPWATVPVNAQSVEKNGSAINKDWYFLWQLVFMVDKFAVCCDLVQAGYSLEALCDRLGVNKVQCKPTLSPSVVFEVTSRPICCVTSCKF